MQNKAIEIINEQLQKLDSIEKKTYSKNPYLESESEKLRRWEDFTSDQIAKNISKKEADKFRKIRPNIPPGIKEDIYLISKYRDFLIAFKEEIQEHPEFVFADSKNIPHEISFIQQGDYYKAVRLISDILGQAKRSLTIIDRYLNDEILDFIPQGNTLTEIRLLIKKASPLFIKYAEAFNKEHKNLFVKISDVFHDRYIIVDSIKYWHLGSSLDRHIGIRQTIFMLINEPFLQNKLKETFDFEWQKATEIISP